MNSNIPVDQIIHTDALTGLRNLTDASVDMVLTSPPYWGCRDYGVKPILWPDGSVAALGLELSFSSYLDHLVCILDEVKRVLKENGTLWLNLGDVFQADERLRKLRLIHRTRFGSSKSDIESPSSPVREKSLCLIPQRCATMLVDRGWILRNHIVWHKTDHLPSSVKDRFASSWEHLFLLTKSSRYYFDLDAVRVPHTVPITPATVRRPIRVSPHLDGRRYPPDANTPQGRHPKGKNPGDVWNLAAGGGGPRHPAAFPERLCERPILAGCPKGGIVLDPFMGSGTTAVVAKRLGRKYLGFEAKGSFVEVARARVAVVHSPHSEGDTSSQPEVSA